MNGLVDDKVVLTILFGNELATHNIMNDRQFESVVEDSIGEMVFRNYSYDPKELEQETLKVEDVL